MELAGFEKLEVYIEARKFRIRIVEVCKLFPQEEKFRLLDQIKRSSRSVTNNIAEGYRRFHYADNIKFCRDARGSLNETMDHLTIAFDEGYILAEVLNELHEHFEKILKLLNGYIAWLKKNKAEQ